MLPQIDHYQESSGLCGSVALVQFYVTGFGHELTETAFRFPDVLPNDSDKNFHSSGRYPLLSDKYLWNSVCMSTTFFSLPSCNSLSMTTCQLILSLPYHILPVSTFKNHLMQFLYPQHCDLSRGHSLITKGSRGGGVIGKISTYSYFGGGIKPILT